MTAPQPQLKTDNSRVVIATPAVIFYMGLLVVTSLMAGYGWAKTGGAKVLGTTTSPTAAPQVQQQAQQQQQPAQPQVSLETIKGLFSKDLVKFGKGDKKLLMVEVSDPSCPYCHIAGGINTEIGAQAGPRFTLTSQGGTYVAPLPEMRKLLDEGKADFVWIYTRGHGNGELATKALYCAYDQGKFWEAHDLLLSAKGYDLLNNQIQNDTSKTQQLVDFLASAVNTQQLKSCLDSGKYNNRLAADSAVAASLGVYGTPGFFLNTTNFGGAYSWNDMKSVAEAALQ